MATHPVLPQVLAERPCSDAPSGARQRSAQASRLDPCVSDLACDKTAGTTLDLFAGFGDTTVLLADGLHQRPPAASSDRRILTFELNAQRWGAGGGGGG